MGPKGAKLVSNAPSVWVARCQGFSKEAFPPHSHSIPYPCSQPPRQDLVALPGPGSEVKLTILKPRSRSISIRLSEEEYSALREVCTETGSRCISEVTRDAVCSFVDATHRGEPKGGISQVQARMKSLEKKIKQLTEEIAAFKPDGSL